MPLILFKPNYKGHRAMVVPRDKALAIQEALKDPTGDMEEDQLDFLQHIEKLYIARDGSEPVNTEHLTHTGIEQGRLMGIPNGDR